MDLFDFANKNEIDKFAPLASRMRPRTLDEFVGQEQIVGPGKLLRRAIEADRLTSLILYGPPGSGKTTLAEIISASTESVFVDLHAVTSGVKELRQIIDDAKERKKLHKHKTTLFIDEIHHFNKSQQDALLPHVENGTIILIGATTENPYFEVNRALLSRSMLFQLNSLSDKDLLAILEMTLQDEERGYGKLNIKIAELAKNHLLSYADGDARRLLNAVELAVATTKADADGKIVVSLTTAEESIQQKLIHYDKDGDKHYDVISAFIKSIRGSDPDAAIYWLARMLEAGENPRFIARRLVISAAEDIGNADPSALQVAIAAQQAYDLLGMPEGRIPLAQATTYLASAPKSNASYLAINQAISDVRTQPNAPVPIHLRDASYQGARELGHGKNYLYPHDYDDGRVDQVYLPEGFEVKKYYKPKNIGYEKNIINYLMRNYDK